MKYICWSYENPRIEIEAFSPTRAAQEYVDNGGWPIKAKKWWCQVKVIVPSENGEKIKTITIAVEPE